MKMKAKLYLQLGLLMVVIVCSSCSKNLTYFTESLYEDNQWSESELKRIQFYVSQDIQLYRTASSGDSRIQDGKIQQKKEKKVDEILISKGTPGTLIFMRESDKYAISFDASGDYLIFAPSKKTRGRFTLRAKKWRDRGQGGVITYGEKEYQTSTESAYAALMVDLRKARRSVVKREKASGRKI